MCRKERPIHVPMETRGMTPCFILHVCGRHIHHPLHGVEWLEILSFEKLCIDHFQSKPDPLWRSLACGCMLTIGLTSVSNSAVVNSSGWWLSPMILEGYVPLCLKAANQSGLPES
jgi:hypothetical protein